MEKELYLKVTLPDHFDFKMLDIEQLVYNEVRSRLEEKGVLKEVLDDWKQFDIVCTDIKFYSKK